MPDVYDEIFEYASKYIKSNLKHSPRVLKEVSETTKLPTVIIEQINDHLYDENLDKSDQRFDLIYEINIYAEDKGTTRKHAIVDELKRLVNNVFDEHYGMNRRANTKAPNADLTVEKRYLRYEAKIDENKKIYRR